jgi:hypothetical protein
VPGCQATHNKTTSNCCCCATLLGCTSRVPCRPFTLQASCLQAFHTTGKLPAGLRVTRTPGCCSFAPKLPRAQTCKLPRPCTLLPCVPDGCPCCPAALHQTTTTHPPTQVVCCATARSCGCRCSKTNTHGHQQTQAACVEWPL